jgi:hypothetical protein
VAPATFVYVIFRANLIQLNGLERLTRLGGNVRINALGGKGIIGAEPKCLLRVVVVESRYVTMLQPPTYSKVSALSTTNVPLMFNLD